MGRIFHFPGPANFLKFHPAESLAKSRLIGKNPQSRPPTRTHIRRDYWGFSGRYPDWVRRALNEMPNARMHAVRILRRDNFPVGRFRVVFGLYWR